jgi:hypothetical protein
MPSFGCSFVGGADEVIEYRSSIGVAARCPCCGAPKSRGKWTLRVMIAVWAMSAAMSVDPPKMSGKAGLA